MSFAGLRVLHGAFKTDLEVCRIGGVFKFGIVVCHSAY